MTRTRIAAAAILTLGLLAPVAVATSASAAPPTCTEAAQVKDHKVNKANAKARDAKAKGKKVGHSKPKFVHAGWVTVDPVDGVLSFTVRGGKVKALRGCVLPVPVTADAKIMRNGAVATLDDIEAGDHVNVKGRTVRNADTGDVSYIVTRVAAEGAVAPAPAS